MMALCMWFTSSSLPLFSGILLPPLQHSPPNPFHQSILPACLRGWCSLAIDALITVGHIEKIVLLMVILQGEKGRK